MHVNSVQVVGWDETTFGFQLHMAAIGPADDRDPCMEELKQQPDNSKQEQPMQPR